jgi:YebC/PmpR family DNA-binding regulatory protein
LGWRVNIFEQSNIQAIFIKTITAVFRFTDIDKCAAERFNRHRQSASGDTLSRRASVPDLRELRFASGSHRELPTVSGHSKWSKIKRVKGVTDQKRGAVFSRLAKEITIAAKTGGGDPAANVRLRSAILSARAQSMPNDNIERAIKRGTGEGQEATHFDEIVYEGYAPGGVAIIVEAATDNKNRTAAEIRRIFTKNDGNLAASGSVSYMFHKKGRINVPRDTIDEDKLFELALEAGAEELTTDDEQYVITTAHDQLYAVAEALKHAGVPTNEQKFTFIPDTTVPVTDEEVALQALRLCDSLEEDDDVQNVYSNLDISDELLARLPA